MSVGQLIRRFINTFLDGSGTPTAVSASNPLPVTSSAETKALIYDDETTYAYLGKADPGTATSAASWQIKKLTYSGDDVTTEFADGDASYDNIWDNRGSLSYS